jgi:hypothetical protein
MRSLLLVCVLLSWSCGAYRAPASYPQPQQVLFYANEVAVGVNMLQHTAIELNRISVCDAGTVVTVEAPDAIAAPPNCHPLLSENNVRAVGETASDVRAALRQTPAGWRAIVTAGLDRMVARLDNAGQVRMAAYLQAVRFLLGSLP